MLKWIEKRSSGSKVFRLHHARANHTLDVSGAIENAMQGLVGQNQGMFINQPHIDTTICYDAPSLLIFCIRKKY